MTFRLIEESLKTDLQIGCMDYFSGKFYYFSRMCMCGIITDGEYLNMFAACIPCYDVFRPHLPPTDSFPQRYVSIGTSLGVCHRSADCLYCYKVGKRFGGYNVICPTCWTKHKQETSRLIMLTFLARELAGTDVGRTIVGYLLYFFGGSPVECSCGKIRKGRV
jgi:hypothetical protein